MTLLREFHRAVTFRRFLALVALSCVAMFFLPSCGAAAGVGAVTSNIVGGFAVKGPIINGTINAYELLPDGSKGELLGTAMTDAKGAFVLVLEDYEGAVWLEVVSGTYVDEASGIEMTLTAEQPLLGIVPDYIPGVLFTNLAITPLTSMAAGLAQRQIEAGADPTDAANAANDQIGEYFGIDDILTTRPPDLTQEGGEPTQNELNYALVLAGLSNVARNSGVDPMDLTYALLDDAEDGAFDGQSYGDPVNVGTGTLSPDATGSDLADGIDGFVDSDMNGAGVSHGDAAGIVDETGRNTGTLPEIGAGEDLFGEAPDALNFVLRWGLEPEDLDLHLATPDIEGTVYHVYYSDDYWPIGEEAPFAGLDMDDTDSYGPETIWITQFYPGTYVVAVYNYSEEAPLLNSGTTLSVRDIDGTLVTFQVPTEGEDGLWWHVCDIDGATGAVTPVNVLQDTEPDPAMEKGLLAPK